MEMIVESHATASTKNWPHPLNVRRYDHFSCARVLKTRERGRMKPSEVERLYGLFGHKVYVRCCYLLREEPAAMDATQDVFATLLERLLSFPDDRRAAAWLRRVATNKCLNELRRRRYWQSRPVDEVPGAASVSPFPFLEDRLLLSQLLTELPTRKASIVVSYFLEGRTLDEAATDNNCSVPTVRRTIKSFVASSAARVGGDGR